MAYFLTNETDIYDLDSRIDWRYRLPKPQEITLPPFTATHDADEARQRVDGAPIGVPGAKRRVRRAGALWARDEHNRVATWNSQSITHDNDGNMTFGPLPGDSSFFNYNFDARNRLTGVGGTTYQYDSENNRIAKITADGTTTYVFDPHGDALPRVLIRERTDESLTYYVYGIGLLYEVDEADNATYYHFDQSGSTIALTSDAGEVTDRVEYTPHGTVSHRTGTADTPFLYAGQFGIQADPNGLLHMRARYYSPELKRFINADPAGFGGGMNWYAYANNSPLMYVDPDGETPVTAIIGGVIGGIVGAAVAWHRGENIIVGALGGAVTGAMIGSGNAIIYAALRAGSIGSARAIGTSALWGGSISMVGNTGTQVANNRINGNNWTSSFAQVSRQQQVVSFASGGAFGGMTGMSSVIRHNTIHHSNTIANTVSQQMRSSSAYLMQTQRAPLSVVHQVQNSYSSGLANAGRSQANNLFRMSFGVETMGAGISTASGWK